MLTEKQKKQRLNYIGGSDVPKILFGQAYTVFFKKLGLDHRTTMSEAAYAGSILEETVAKQFFEPYTGLKVRKINKHLIHPKYEWLAANVDFRISGERIVYEGKCRTAYKRKAWGRVECDPREFDFNGKILNYKIPDMDEAEGYLVPRDEYYQVQHYLLFDHLFDSGIICALIDGNTVLTRHILPNKEVKEEILDRTHDFWYNHVKKLKSPTPTAADIETVKKNFGASTAGYADLSENEKLMKWLQLYDELDLDIKSAKSKKDEIKTWILAEMVKNNKGVVCNGRKITYSRTQNRIFMGTVGKGYKINDRE